MTRRPIVVLAAIAVGFTALAVAATLRWLIPQIDMVDIGYEGAVEQSEMDAYYTWISSGWVYYDQVSWLVMAALISGLAALALAAFRAQRRRQTVSATSRSSTPK